MVSCNKYICLLIIGLICFSILLFLKPNEYIQRLTTYSFISRTNIVYENFTCETWKKFSYIDIQKYKQCLKWTLNNAFWPVSGIRHTSFKHLLNSSSLIIEVGGNIGHDTSKFIQLYNSSIISFEPLVPMAKDLIEKFKTNRKVEIQPFGLGNRARNLSIEPFDTSNVGTSIFRKVSAKISAKIQQIELLDVVRVIENIRKTRTQNGIIDMISVNCEGCEFEILPALILNDLTQYFRIIQFGSHMRLVTESSCIYCQIEQALERTHEIKYHYRMVWEGWVLKNKIGN
ncbi:unnamed protein product [Rotaria sordida]|uniref:Methyltransferase FkbM domain-containing protein n=1 Tax=Rotaria sordida TaxID=392033 RepID=A0A814UNF1_9BILA|nr:unnamed protein product [Rotaria sordida]